jgi:hypothetical protein
MPKKSYPLEAGSSRTVDLAWRGIWKDFTVSVDGRELGRMNGQDELVHGGSWTLEDGSRLQVILDKSLMNVELQVTRNGVPLPGSASDPKARFAAAAGIIFFIAGLNVVLGALAEFAQVKLLLDMGLGWGVMIFGLIYGGLGLAVRKGSRVALVLAIGLFAVDGILTIYFGLEAGGQPPIGGIVFRVFLLAAMIKALGAGKPSS